MSNKQKFCFVSCAFGDERYIYQQDRLRTSITNIYPDIAESITHFNRGTVAPGALAMSESLYGFKVHAIHAQLKLYDYVIWCDPAMVLWKPVDELLKVCDNNQGVYAVKDDNKLIDCVSDLALQYFDYEKDTVKSKDMHLVGGSLYIFNSNSFRARAVFNDWYKSEIAGIFGTAAQAASNRINGHRNDESCLALAMYANGVEPIPYDVAKYNNGEASVFVKEHFK